MKLRTRVPILLGLVALCAAAALTTGVLTRSGSTAQAGGSCQLGNKDGQIKHVVYLQFDNTHYNRDVKNVPSDLEQMPHLLDFLKSNGTLLTNDHTILISHTAGGILSSLTGLYPDRDGQTVSNSYGYFGPDGTPQFSSSFKYWTDVTSATLDPLPNMVSDGGQTAQEPWLAYTAAGCNVGGVSAANIELENSSAIAITSLAATANAGDTNIKVGSVAAMAPGQQLTIDKTETTTIASVGTAGANGTGVTLTGALTAPHASGAPVYGPDPSGDMTRVFGVGSPEWNEARDSQLAPSSNAAAKNLAQTDFVGIAVHCGQGQALCQNNTGHRPDDQTIYPGSDGGYQALFGAKYVNPAIGGTQADGTGNGNCVQAIGGGNITDPTNQCGFPGFDGALAKNTLGEVAQMQEHGVPVTFAYISDAHDDHVTATASGPGEARYVQQLKDYDTAFQGFFDRLQKDGIDKSNTLFVITVDEGDHFTGGPGTPDGNGGFTYTHTPCPVSTQTPTCPSNQIGEITTDIKGLLPATEPPFSVHSDDAPTIYVNGNPPRTDGSVRQLGYDISQAKGIDPYQNGSSVPITVKLADSVGEQALHMVSADPRRTPTLTLFGNDDFFFQVGQSSTCSPKVTECADSKFAWNHGDNQQEIANTWLGMVGPGVQSNGIDGNTWTDHTDARPTMLALLGLSDSYLDDGRVITQLVDDKAEPKTLDKHDKDVTDLGTIYKQLNAPFGAFAQDLLTASTTALSQKPDQAGNLKYDSIESQIATLTTQRTALAGTIRQALNDAAKGVSSIDKKEADDWTSQAQSLLDQAHKLSLSS
jgi:hypothetical protein